jgi:hypothetical protein
MAIKLFNASYMTGIEVDGRGGGGAISPNNFTHAESEGTFRGSLPLLPF